MQEPFRDAMAGVPAGVAVIAAPWGSGFRGLTASSFTAASLEPPLLLVCLDSLAQTRDAVVEARRFAVSVLERSQEFVAERFAGRAPSVDPEWREVPHTLGANGLPIVSGCVAWFECELRQRYTAGDHDVVIGAVSAAGREAGEPLVLWDRAFWRLA